MRDEESAYQRRSDNAEKTMRSVSLNIVCQDMVVWNHGKLHAKPEKRRPLFDELNCTSLCTNPLFQLH